MMPEDNPSQQPSSAGGGSEETREPVHSEPGNNNTAAAPMQEAGDGTPATDSQQSTLAITVQKRRRVTRACDECRRKKIKCDGKQPCTHCTVYSYDCTYDKPSNRRRNAAPQYIEALESRLHKAEALVRAILPDIDTNDPRYDACSVEEILSSLKKDKTPATVVPKPESKQSTSQDTCEESLLESMVDNTGSLDMDDEGHWDYHGHSSGLMFVRRVRNQIDNFVPEQPPARFQQISHILEGVKSASESPIDTHLSPIHDLPCKDVARKLCTNSLEDACCIMRFLHKPTFWAMFDRIYDTPVEQFTNEENSFLPVLYLALAVGCLFRGVGDSTLEKSGYEPAVDQGFQYFKAGRQLVDITECRDLTSLQAICFMVLFLQASANLRTCYSYIGIALRAALRLGLHRSVPVKFNPIELETRKRVFWVVRKMDVHVSTILGLPAMLSEDDIDQEYPTAVDDEYITKDGILPMPSTRVSLMLGATAHMRLGHIVLKVMKYIYPVKVTTHGINHTYMVNHSKIRELERDLQKWMEDLPDAFRPGGETTPEIERMRQLLRICYAHVQMVMYRPFLHYVTGGSKNQEIDKRSYACAAACVSVARNVVHITAGMKKKQLLNGSYWFTMYTTYFAILALLFFILENPESAATKEGILKDALEGKNALAGLAKRSMAADRCAQSLNSIFKYLPEKLRNRQRVPSVSRKRSQPPNNASSTSLTESEIATPPKSTETDGPHPAPIQRASTFPVHVASNNLKNQNSQDSPQPPSRTVDDTHAIRAVGSPHHVGLSRSNSGVPSHTDSVQTHLSSPTSPLLPQGQQQQDPSWSKHDISFSPPFNNPARLPDLMPMMFPSDDPFAYPNQPLSTLEDDHFGRDRPTQSDQFMFGNGQSMSTGMSNTPHNTSLSSPGLSVADGNATFMAGLPSHFKNTNRFSNTQDQASDNTQMQNNFPLMENPDVVTIPQPFGWQGLSTPGASDSVYQYSGPEQLYNGVSNDFGMGTSLGMAMGMGLDMDMKFDSAMMGNSDNNNNNNSGVGGGGDPSTDWIQWGNWNNNMGEQFDSINE